MFKHYLTTAWRNFLRFKTATIISTVGLALGIACFIAAITALTYIESADRQLPNADRIVMIWQSFSDRDMGLRAPFTAQTSRALAPTLRKEFPELVAVAQIRDIGTMPVVTAGHRVFVDAAVADPEYLRILDLPRVQVVKGNPLAEPRSAILSEAAARSIFGTTDVLGKTIRLEDALDVVITAVVKPLPQPSHMSGPYGIVSANGILINRDTEAAITQALTGKPPRTFPIADNWAITFGSATYALLPEGRTFSAALLESGLYGIAERNGSPAVMTHHFRVTPLSQIFLRSLDLNLLFSTMGSTSIRDLMLLLAFSVLAVACANYANLAFAQTCAHAQEIGLRRTIGARRSQLAAQAFVEAVCHVMVASVFAFAIVAALALAIEEKTQLSVLDAVMQSARFWVTTALFSLLIAIGVALYPALTLARVQPAQAIRAAAQSGYRFGTRLLLGIQFVATSVLVVVLSVVYLQSSHIKDAALRPSADPLITLGETWSRGNASFDTWRNELSQNPAILSVSATNSPPWDTGFSGLFPITPVGGTEIFNALVADVEYDFETALGLQVIAGRSFDRTFGDIARARTDQPTLIVDETLAKYLGFSKPADAIGKSVRRTGAYAATPPFTIVGVVADSPLRLQPFLDFIGNAYIPASAQYQRPIIKVDRNQIAAGLSAIDATWKKLNPSEAVERQFADESFTRVYAFHSLAGNVLTAISCIALLISLLGAFGFATFIGRRRAHEIGVRKTLGASVSRIVAMLLHDFSKPIVIANLVAWPLAYVAAKAYLSMFVQRIDLTLAPFVLSLMFTLLVTWIAIGRQAWRAARLNPASVLRYE